jgi:hypothetical protein
MPHLVDQTWVCLELQDQQPVRGQRQRSQEPAESQPWLCRPPRSLYGPARQPCARTADNVPSPPQVSYKFALNAGLSKWVVCVGGKAGGVPWRMREGGDINLRMIWVLYSSPLLNLYPNPSEGHLFAPFYHRLGIRPPRGLLMRSRQRRPALLPSKSSTMSVQP